MTTDTQSVLDSMTAAIINRKKGVATATGLTPVGFEAPRQTYSDIAAAKVTSLAGRHDTMFPYDDPQTVHTAIAHGLELVEEVKAELDHVAKGLTALGALYSTPDPLPAEPVEDPVRAAEREADARAREREAQFKAEMEAKQAAAQAQVFGWTCSTHGDTAIATLTSRKGRAYRSCAECFEFEKEVTV